MFKRANRVSRVEKALILGFMAGYRDNPRPNPENIVTIKLNESQVRRNQFYVEHKVGSNYKTKL